jgi:hypothetical protein
MYRPQIYSGVLADAELASVLQENAFEGDARIYQDGLECADGAEDCTFVIWMRKRDHHSLRTKRTPAETHQLTKPSEHYNPPLLGKPATVLLVLRARSKVKKWRLIAHTPFADLSHLLPASWNETNGLKRSRSRFSDKPWRILSGHERPEHMAWCLKGNLFDEHSIFVCSMLHDISAG